MNAIQERIKDVHPSDLRFGQVRTWFKRSQAASDPFERFFFAYIGLLIAARTGVSGSSVPDERAVKDFIEDLQDEIPVVVAACRSDLQWFAERDLPSGQMLLDVSLVPNDGDLDYFWSLRDYVALGAQVPSHRVAKGLARLVIRVRNNLFHGAKDYMPSRDCEVLEHTNPIILHLVERFLNDAPGAPESG